MVFLKLIYERNDNQMRKSITNIGELVNGIFPLTKQDHKCRVCFSFVSTGSLLFPVACCGMGHDRLPKFMAQSKAGRESAYHGVLSQATIPFLFESEYRQMRLLS